MSGQKRFEKAIRNNRVVAIPSKKIKRVAEDVNGNVVRDKDGKAVVEEVQLYRIHKMK
jgi:hypothetical protein